MAEMNPVSIEGTAIVRVGGVEVTKKFSISTPISAVMELQTGVANLSIDCDELKRKSALILDWLKAFPSELEIG